MIKDIQNSSTLSIDRCEETAPQSDIENLSDHVHVYMERCIEDVLLPVYTLIEPIGRGERNCIRLRKQSIDIWNQSQKVISSMLEENTIFYTNNDNIVASKYKNKMYRRRQNTLVQETSIFTEEGYDIPMWKSFKYRTSNEEQLTCATTVFCKEQQRLQYELRRTCHAQLHDRVGISLKKSLLDIITNTEIINTQHHPLLRSILCLGCIQECLQQCLFSVRLVLLRRACTDKPSGLSQHLMECIRKHSTQVIDFAQLFCGYDTWYTVLSNIQKITFNLFDKLSILYTKDTITRVVSQRQLDNQEMEYILPEKNIYEIEKMFEGQIYFIPKNIRSIKNNNTIPQKIPQVLVYRYDTNEQIGSNEEVIIYTINNTIEEKFCLYGEADTETHVQGYCNEQCKHINVSLKMLKQRVICNICIWHTQQWSPNSIVVGEIVKENIPLINYIKPKLHNTQKLLYPIQRLNIYPSVQKFAQYYLYLGIPVVLHKYAQYWPAVQEDGNKQWRQSSSKQRECLKNRYVPVEMGSTYQSSTWLKKIVSGSLILETNDNICNNTITAKNTITQELLIRRETFHPQYLAQHALLEQIPEQRNDIGIPDYCSVAPMDTTLRQWSQSPYILDKNVDMMSIHKYMNLEMDTQITVRVWIGPTGTISPLHYDPKDNFLIQIYGYKYIRLYAPKETNKQYPHESSSSLRNTSQVNVEDVAEEFPLFHEAIYTETILGPGDTQYIPYRWWHYVKSLTPSCSVNYWWEGIRDEGCDEQTESQRSRSDTEIEKRRNEKTILRSCSEISNPEVLEEE